MDTKIEKLDSLVGAVVRANYWIKETCTEPAIAAMTELFTSRLIYEARVLGIGIEACYKLRSHERVISAVCLFLAAASTAEVGCGVKFEHGERQRVIAALEAFKAIDWESAE